MSRLFVAVMMVLLADPAAASAPSEIFGSEETVSLATGRVQSLRTAPAVATVITAEDLRNGGFRNVVEALQLVPGFHLGVYSSYYPNLLVRGFSSPWSAAVLVLLDGVAQTDLVAGNAIGVLGTIPLDVIERIEVTRGPGSSQFGADAFSAVVNVITKTRAPTSQVAISGGSYDTVNGRLLVGGETPSGAIVFSAERMRTDGHRPTIDIDRLTGLDALLGTHRSYAPRAANTQRDTGAALLNVDFGATRAMLRFSRWSDYGLGAGLVGVVDPLGSISLQTVEGRVDHDIEWSDRLDLTLRLDAAQTRHAFEDVLWRSPSLWFPGRFLVDTSAEQDHLRARADLRFDAGERHFLTAGIGYEQGRYKVDTWDGGGADGWLAATVLVPDYDGTRRLLFGYLQDEWLIAPRWSLTWGLRVDDYSDVGTRLSPRAVLVWTPGPAWTAKLLYGEGFRAPTSYELEGGLLPIFRPNPQLEPERLRTLELALHYQPRPTLAVGLNLFRHETVDQIRQQDRLFYVAPENVGRQIGEGAELEIRWSPRRDLTLRGWYAYQYNTDETTGEDAGYSPHHRLYGSLQYRLGRTFFNLQGTYVGERARVAEDSRSEPPEYGQLDLLVRHDLAKRVSVQLDIRNLLDAQLEEAAPGTSLPQDLPLPGRNYYATLEMRF
jgi:iron complex outermembrane receptor protein